MSSLSGSLKLPCGDVLPNRIAKAAMTEGLADAHNRATQSHVNLYEKWSKGGAGLLLTGNVQIDRRHLERPGNVAIDGNDGWEQLRAYARAGTMAGNHLWMQISHAGRQTPISVNPAPLAPSAVPLDIPMGFGAPTAMSEADILDVVERFGRVAETAQATGFTGVQIHSAHGYLLSGFLSPLANRRTDRWGGPLENRARLLIEVVRRVRRGVGARFPVAVKLNSADFQTGGFSSDEAEQVVVWLGVEGIDLLEISGGSYEKPAMARGIDIGGAAEPLRESTGLREAYFLDFAARLHPIAAMPLMVTGGFRSRSAMELALASGSLDLVGLARPFCTAPDLPNALIAGLADAAPAYERSLRLDRSLLLPGTDERTIQNLENWSRQAWFCVQLLRMGAGLDPDTGLALSAAAEIYRQNESKSAAGLTT